MHECIWVGTYGQSAMKAPLITIWQPGLVELMQTKHLASKHLNGPGGVNVGTLVA